MPLLHFFSFTEAMGVAAGVIVLVFTVATTLHSLGLWTRPSSHWRTSGEAIASAALTSSTSPMCFYPPTFRYTDVWISQGSQCVEQRNLCWVIDFPPVVASRKVSISLYHNAAITLLDFINGCTFVSTPIFFSFRYSLYPNFVD